MKKILLINCSPRVGGNSDIIEEHLTSTFDDVESIRLRDYDYYPCNGCDGCKEIGECIHNDDASMLYKDILDREIILFVAPVYFFGFDGHTKSFIDRAQFMWSRLLCETKRNRKSYLIAVGGQNSFDGIDSMEKTLKCLGITMGAEYQEGRYFGKVDSKGDIKPQLSAVRSFFRTILEEYNKMS